MKIEKAIELNEDTKRLQLLRGEVEHAKATGMGNEALKRELEYRESMPPQEGELLPGETA